MFSGTPGWRWPGRKGDQGNPRGSGRAGTRARVGAGAGRTGTKHTLAMLVCACILGIVTGAMGGAPPAAGRSHADRAPAMQGSEAPVSPLTPLRRPAPDPRPGRQPRLSERPDTQGAGGGPQEVVAGRWTNLYPQLAAVDAVSGTEAWAVGEYGHLLHYTGGLWVAVDPPAMRGLYLSDIDMVSASGGWVAAGPRAFHYSGGNWVEASTGLGGNISVYRISALADNNVWGVGYTTNPCCQPVLMHWDGARWSAVAAPVPGTATLSDISMVSAGSGWAVGYDLSGDTVSPVVLRYEGAAWIQMPVPPGAAYLDFVSAVSATEAWAVGENSQSASQVYRYNGGLWVSWPIPDNSFAQGILMLNSTHGWVATDRSIFRWDGAGWVADYSGRSVTGVTETAGRVWAVGDADTVLNRLTAGSWELQRGGPTTSSLYAVYALSTTDAWAVGSARGGGGTATILHYDGSAWQAVSTTHPYTLWDIQMLSPTEGYAVGNGGVLRWDGSSWNQVSSSIPLYSLYMTGSGEGWAVGPNGTIMRAAGGVWASVPSPTSEDLLAVSMDSPTHGWAVGGNYPYGLALLEYTGGRWVDRTDALPAGSPRYLSDIWLAAGGQSGWIAGNRQPGVSLSPLLRLNAGTWAVAGGINAAYLERLAPEALGEMMAVGCGVYHYAGGAWQQEVIPSNWCQYDVGLVPGRGGWTVGPYGTILGYNPLSPGQRFYDVPVGSAFYGYIECIASRGIIGGYADNTFRPDNPVTRGQLSKIVANAAGIQDPIPSSRQTFSDVPPSHPFWVYIERLSARGILGGYSDGTFRPDNNATRGQISKIVANAAGIQDPIPSSRQTFVDVPPTHPFWVYIERLVGRGILGGYSDGTFRPDNNATRGQTAKIVSNAFFPGCGTQSP